VTWLYVCGIPPADLEPLPVPTFSGSLPIDSMGVREREATPAAMARWLVAVARRCQPSGDLAGAGDLTSSPAEEFALW
jgi:hypothetical protein